MVGVFGPRLSERPRDDWIPLGDVADTTRQIQAQMEVEAMYRPTDAATPTRTELAELVKSTLDTEWRAPDLSASGFVAVLAGPAVLPGGAPGIAILYERPGESMDRFLALFVTVDGGLFASFNDFGRMEPLSLNRSIIEADEVTDPNSPATLVFSDGDLLFIARAGTTLTLREVLDELGAP